MVTSMDVTITSRGELADWLADKPREWAQVIAIRSTLRVLPASADPQYWAEGRVDPAVMNSVFRVVAVSWAAANYPADDRLFATLAGRATTAARDAAYAKDAAHPTAYATVDAVAASAHVVGAPAGINNATAYAAERAAGAARRAAYGNYADITDFGAYSSAVSTDATATAAAVGIWETIQLDCRALESGADLAIVLQVPLWPNAPDWWSDTCDAARRWLSASPDGFDIWREWYFGRVQGLPRAFKNFDEAANREFYKFVIAQDDDWWRRAPGEVNADIKAKVKELRRLADAEPSTLTPEETRTILEQTADPEAIYKDGRFTIRASLRLGSTRSVAPKELAETLIDLSAMLADGLEDNAPRALRSALSTYSKSLARNPKQPSSDTLDPAAGVVRKLHGNDGHEIWAKGLDEGFESFLSGHARLFGKLPEPKKQAGQRAKLTLNEEARAASLEEDVQRLRTLAETLKDAGLTDADLDAYFVDLIELGTEIAFGGPDFDQPDKGNETAPKAWSPKDLFRANEAGLVMQIHTVFMTVVSLTAHPSYPAIVASLTDFVAHMLLYFV